MLLILSQESSRNCFIESENNYALAVLNFAIETGDKSPLNAFMTIREFDNINKDIMKAFNKLDGSKLETIRQELNSPFNPLEVTILE